MAEYVACAFALGRGRYCHGDVRFPETHSTLCPRYVSGRVPKGDSIPKVGRNTMTPQDTKTPTCSAIEFTTQNSRYVFTWLNGQRHGVLFCERGTFAGKSMVMQTEDIRDLAWPGERILTEDFRSTKILTVKR